MVLTGDLASLNTTEASEQPAAQTAPSKVENGHADEESDDDVVMVEPPQSKASVAGTKRKMEEEDSQPTEKRLRVAPIEV